jgi:hypothetical protein
MTIEHVDSEDEGPAIHLDENETRTRVPRLASELDTAPEGGSGWEGQIEENDRIWGIMGCLNETARDQRGEDFMRNEVIEGRVNWTGTLFEIGVGAPIE